MGLPPLTPAWRFLAACFIVLFVSTLYLVPMYMPFMTATVLAPTALDRAVPFVEWTIWIYYSYAVFLVLPVVLSRTDRCAARVVRSIMSNSILAAAVFFVWPTAGVAQEPTSGGSVGLLWSVLQAVDRPVNLFPSLHIANTCTCALALWRERRGWRRVAPVWAVAIALSTLTTKQHLLVDLFGGLALAGFSDWLAVNQVWEFASMGARRSCPAKSPDGSAPFMRLPSNATPKSATNT